MSNDLFDLSLLNPADRIYEGEEIPLIIRNNSNHSIWFPADLNLSMGIEINERDLNILRNESAWAASDDIILGEIGTENNEYQFSVLPDIPGTKGEIIIQILVRGNIYQDGEICSGVYYSILPVSVYREE